MAPGPRRRRRVLLVLPFPMSARVVLDTPVLAQLAASPDLDVTFVTRDPSDAETVRREQVPHLRWAALPRPRERGMPPVRRMRLTASHLLHLAAAHRFNRIHGFVGFQNRLEMSRSLRRIALREAHPVSRVFGFPRPRSRRVHDALYRLHYGTRVSDDPAAEALLREAEPDLLAVVHVQTPAVTPLLRAARAAGVPIAAMVGSWDQPTTKGRIPPDLVLLLAQSAYVRDQVVELHGVDPRTVEVVGWPQLDVFLEPGEDDERARVLSRLGLDHDRRLVLFGAYAERLGGHEPAVLERLAQVVTTGGLPERTTLVVRSHPLDMAWRERLGHLHAPPQVVVQPPSRGDLRGLAALLRQSHVVVSSAGTICLDAAVVDTPALGLAFSDDAVPATDRPERLFESEHYASAVATGGVRLAEQPDHLVTLIRDRLEDPGLDAEGRARLRALHLEPLDGRASERVVAALTRAAGAGAAS